MPIRKIQIVPTWSFRDDQGNRLDAKLFDLLRHIERQHRLTAAARDSGLSYRHAWNLLNKWADFFGVPLVKLQKGRGAKLTALGEKLLWAEKRVVARLEPQLDNLTSELNIELRRIIEGERPRLSVHASHGYAVELLPKFADGFELDLQYRSEYEALEALGSERCDIAGFHVPVDQLDTGVVGLMDTYLNPHTHRVISFITRQLGIMVAAGNPASVKRLEDIAQRELRFINREKGSGTRKLLDLLLKNESVDTDRIIGYQDEEFTHSAVAAYVAAGMADVGFGVEAAARQFGLGFIPVTRERYLFICHRRTLEREACIRLLQQMRSEAFHQAVADLPGYSATKCGQVVELKSFDEVAAVGD